MIYLSLPYNKPRKLPFFLAMEEYAAQLLKTSTNIDEFFFMWQVCPTVIFGRNQLIDSEVNIDYCKSHGIEYYRRKSGGGCVYADMDNIMFSYITRSNDVKTTFSNYTSRIVKMLQDLGLNASDNSRNDIMIDDKKVSGNAFYNLPGMSIVHGTMLYDTCMDNMLKAITPSSMKLDSKGVKSVKSHITTLNQYLSMSIDDFIQHVKATLCVDSLMLNKDEIAEIERIEKSYLTAEFILGNNPRCNIQRNGRINNVGEINIRLELKHNTILNINIAGDFFMLGDIEAVESRLKGKQFTLMELNNALNDIDMSKIIMNLSNKDFIELLIN